MNALLTVEGERFNFHFTGFVTLESRVGLFFSCRSPITDSERNLTGTVFLSLRPFRERAE